MIVILFDTDIKEKQEFNQVLGFGIFDKDIEDKQEFNKDLALETFDTDINQSSTTVQGFKKILHFKILYFIKEK